MLKAVTKVHKANSKSVTLKSSIPKEIANILELETGDFITWNVEIVSPEELKIVVTKKEWFIFFKNSICFIIYEQFNLSKAFAKPLKLRMQNSLNSILYLNNFKAFFKVKYKYI